MALGFFAVVFFEDLDVQSDDRPLGIGIVGDGDDDNNNDKDVVDIVVVVVEKDEQEKGTKGFGVVCL